MRISAGSSRIGSETAMNLITEAPKQNQQPSHPKTSITKLSGLGFALLLIGFFSSFSLLPMVWSSSGLSHAFWGAAGALLVMFFGLKCHLLRSDRRVFYEWAPRPVHYVQLLMHTSIYLYWGSYWREVYQYAPLIAAQIVFAYALDMMLCWWRRDKWVAGFGPFPIVLSTNLFLWFRGDWFFLQFLLVGSALASKELLRWKRDNRLTHIFNPSAFGLFIFSIALIVSRETNISRAGEIAFTLSYPPHIYLEIFVIGLIVQALFSVTLVTLSSVTTLWLFNVAYTQLTGIHQFTDSNIPVLVFLGAHLLVTDPATSPRTSMGKIIFGGLYGASVFGLRGILGSLSIPLFYDKLLCVPALNLTAPALDRISRALAAHFPHLDFGTVRHMRYSNILHMTVWVIVFIIMSASDFLGYSNIDANPASWRVGCIHGRGGDCVAWMRALRRKCDTGSGVDCFTLGRVLADGRIVPGDSSTAGDSLNRACNLGYAVACTAPATGHH